MRRVEQIKSSSFLFSDRGYRSDNSSISIGEFVSNVVTVVTNTYCATSALPQHLRHSGTLLQTGLKQCLALSHSLSLSLFAQERHSSFQRPAWPGSASARSTEATLLGSTRSSQCALLQLRLWLIGSSTSDSACPTFATAVSQAGHLPAQTRLHIARLR